MIKMTIFGQSMPDVLGGNRDHTMILFINGKTGFSPPFS